MKKPLLIVGALAILLTACGTAQAPAPADVASVPATTADVEAQEPSPEATPTPTPTPSPSPEPSFDLDVYEEQVKDFAVATDANMLKVAGVCVYQKTFWENYQKIAGSGAAPSDIVEKGYTYVEEQTGVTKDDIEQANAEIEELYKGLILVEFEGKEAEELDAAVRDMYAGYKGIYDLSNSTASKNGLSAFISTYNDSAALFTSGKDTISLFVDLPEDE